MWICEVVFHTGFYLQGKKGGIQMMSGFKDYEGIGNIFENENLWKALGNAKGIEEFFEKL